MPMIFFVASSYGLGLALIPLQAVGAFASDTTLKLATWGAFQSVMCDCMISMSVYFYLRPSRSGVKRMDTHIQSITKNFISMGILSWQIPL
ncbi:hypothetical protein K503DRAFT_799712 [Rhizopogon vinicolor AM-OR11-026]|uniref:Uncharacterized protein n=1 Tax=Rhizopogon vinicolor AM-OR11-026 TaxID=1314800 RepID=A0A1B7N3F6_9AGAM|nr:hypothetical protein K503DRAFT_799712 [Rhizopogon vinicolor AM-OR11-026]